MKRRLAEETVLFVSILKWFILATVTGAIVGTLTALFIHTLNKITVSTAHFPYFFLSLPLVLFLNQILMKKIAPRADAYSTNRVIRAIHHQEKITVLSVLKAFVGPILTIAAGGSAGKEAPAADIGAGAGSLLGGLFRFDAQDRGKLMICGVSAGFAAVFGTPIAGALFGVEVLFVGGLLYDVLLPSFIAGITAYHVSNVMGIAYFYHPLHFVPQFSEFFLIEVCLAGVFFGICSFLLIEMMRFGEKVAAKLKMALPLKGFVGGVFLVVLALLFSKDYLGLGLQGIERCLQGQGIPWYAAFMKMIFTSVTLNFGGAGGIVTPIFFIGASAGSLFAGWFGLDHATLSAIGFVALLAGAANTPIAASVMAIEIFGPRLAPYATVACVVSFLMTGHRSVYPAQILSVKKSPSISAELGDEMQDIRAQVSLRKKSLAKNLKDVYLFIKERFRRRKRT